MDDSETLLPAIRSSRLPLEWKKVEERTSTEGLEAYLSRDWKDHWMRTSLVVLHHSCSSSVKGIPEGVWILLGAAAAGSKTRVPYRVGPTRELRSLPGEFTYKLISQLIM